MPNYQGVGSLSTQFQNASGWPDATAPVALFGGGGTASIVHSTIDRIQILSTGNATDFGDFSAGRYFTAGNSNGTRAIWGGGGTAILTAVNIIEFTTFGTTGSITDFGDLRGVSTTINKGGGGNSTRGLMAGGWPSGNFTAENFIDYITMASAGNSLDFGDLSVARSPAGNVNSTTRAVFGSGATGGGGSNVIDYVTTASLGNATDFGDMTYAPSYATGCSNSTRGLFAGGYITGRFNTIDYITIASTGNATDFGDMTVAAQGRGAAADSVYGVFAGGHNDPDYYNNIDYVTIGTTGNATDFGDLTVGGQGITGCSAAHGGLS